MLLLDAPHNFDNYTTGFNLKYQKILINYRVYSAFEYSQIRRVQPITYTIHWIPGKGGLRVPGIPAVHHRYMV
jgi:hypothetical protein